MCEIVLEIPTARHRITADAYYKDFLRHGEGPRSNTGLTRIEYTAWMGDSYRNSRATTAREDWVPSTTLFAVRKKDNKIIGNTCIRHNLNQEILQQYGGHIGYAVCPGERGKGYGTSILELTLDYCRNIGLNKVMLSCYKNNKASRRIIEKCGGIFERAFREKDQEILVYWINIQ